MRVVCQKKKKKNTNILWPIECPELVCILWLGLDNIISIGVWYYGIAIQADIRI